jgi:hypothetical protein
MSGLATPSGSCSPKPEGSLGMLQHMFQIVAFGGGVLGP